MEKKFLIDLSGLDLTHEHIAAIDSAIQKTVAAEIARLNFKKEVAFVPLKKSRGIGGHDITTGIRGDYKD
ncbi:MAG: hypothetical protein JST26_19825 [Bacteroidetes bacterium]|nr:hypothetical protein [Bacteroidota bacterium]